MPSPQATSGTWRVVFYTPDYRFVFFPFFSFAPLLTHVSTHFPPRIMIKIPREGCQNTRKINPPPYTKNNLEPAGFWAMEKNKHTFNFSTYLHTHIRFVKHTTHTTQKNSKLQKDNRKNASSKRKWKVLSDLIPSLTFSSKKMDTRILRQGKAHKE